MARPISAKPPRLWLARIVLGLGLVAVGVYEIWDYTHFEAVAQHATARILDVRRETKATGRRGNRVEIARPVVRFTPVGALKPVEAVAKVAGHAGEFIVGRDVAVEFDPERPAETVRVDTGISFLELGLGVIGVGVAWSGADSRRKWGVARRAETAPTTPRV